MIHETEEEKLLFDYAKKYSIDELSVEDIIKLSRTNTISSIVQAFDVSGKEFRDLRKQIGLSNIYLEDAIRNIEVILFYLDSRDKYFSSRIRKKIIDILIYEFGNVSSKREFNLRKLAEIDFSREKVRKDLENKQIDIEERLKEIEEFVSYIEKLIDYLIEQEKIYLIHCNNKRMYNQLYESKKRGSTFSKDELTYDVLFELSVIENIPDSLIGEIYDLKKNQVRYLRTKVGLSNLHKTKMEIYPETLTYYMEEHNQRPLGASNEDCERIVSQLIENLFGTDIEHDKSSTETVCGNEVTIDVGDEKVTYYVNFSDEKYSVNTSISNKKSNGSRRNQKRENETKRLHGKIGEKIALEAERMRLMKMGLSDLVDDVKLVAQIDEEITLDGVGYDLISFNEDRERICIEVKTSYGTKDKPFFISDKEIEIMKGLKVEYACKVCLIYYVLIDDFNVTIKNIQPYDFNNIKLKPILYKVESTSEFNEQ